VAADDYYIYAVMDGYVGEIWPNAPCPYQVGIYNCALDGAQTVTVAAGATVSGIDFGLTTGARIAGRVIDRLSGAAVINAQVVAYDDQTGLAGSVITDAAGRYQLTGLVAGTFRAQVQGSSYLSQAYDNIDCQQYCDSSVGTPIVLADQESFDAADFALAPLVWVTVTVNLVEEDPPFYSPIVSIVAPDGTTAGPFSVWIGEPSTIGPVVPGSYYFYADTNGYISQIFDHVDCPADCASYLAHGTLVTVPPTGEPPQLTFDLSPTPAVTGRVTDATTGAGLANVTLQLWSVTNGFVTRDALTGADGSYRIAGPDPGAYYVVARSSDHQDRAYPDAPCSDLETYSLEDCTLSNAEQITVEARGSDVTGIDLALPLNATIEGTVRFRVNGGAGGVLSNTTVRVYDSYGIALTYSMTDADGRYALGDLSPGTYYFEGSAPSYFSEIYSGIDCPVAGQECNPTPGTPIALTQGQTLDAIDFDLVGAESIVGRVTDARSGRGLSGVAIDTWNSSDDMHCGVNATDADGYYAAIDNVSFCNGAARKLSTDAGNQYIDQVFDGITCPEGPAYLGLCPLDNATLIAVPTTVPQPIEADFVLHRGDQVFSDGFE
jgi:protocatechuate 3,4-dioxygenase beta subunit